MVRARGGRRVSDGKAVAAYEHGDKTRLNNPPVVTPDSDADRPAKRYEYDPHLDPQLVWAGKAEHTSFEVPTVSLHVHERIDPRTIVAAVRRDGERPAGEAAPRQLSLFDRPVENPPLREAIDFYKRARGWSKRLIAGDSPPEKERLDGQVNILHPDRVRGRAWPRDAVEVLN
jgi:adenine-specific DNA-methyltransferase